MKKVIALIVIILTLLADQITKGYFIPILDNGNTIDIFSHLKLIGLWNSGISFGLFSTLKYSNVIFSCSSILIAIFLIYYLTKEKSKFLTIGFSLIIGGAIGNIIDRLRFNAVYDFIDFYIGNWHWPAFNLADSFIVLGMLLILFKWYCYDIIFCKSKHSI